MDDKDLLQALRRLKVETGSLACMGCGHEHNCGVHGCAIIRAAADRIEGLLKNEEQYRRDSSGTWTKVCRGYFCTEEVGK